MRGFLVVFSYYHCLYSGRALWFPLFDYEGITKMLSRRQEIVNHYLQKSGPIKEAAAAAATTDHHLFQGDDLCEGVVVRVDLNGYSDWAQFFPTHYRVNLLNDFFTKVLTYLAQYEGIYFRDEGDCVVSLFSPYFGTEEPYVKSMSFCEAVVSDCYGPSNYPLTAKAIVATGEVMIYQKSNEVCTKDWSAEGEPFVRAVRIEQAVESKQQIYYFADEYDELFIQYTQYTEEPVVGKKYYWQLDRKDEEIQGLGSVELAIEKYIPGGRTYLSPDIISYLSRLNR